MQKQFRFLTHNIERRKHLDKVLLFLEKKQPEIVCLQEVFEDTFENIKRQFDYEGVFVPRIEMRQEPGTEGFAVLSKFPITDSQVRSYDQFTEPISQLKHMHLRRPVSALLIAKINFEGNPITVATTHFTWSGGGQVSDEQRINFKKLESILDQLPELILAGDFNTPRGQELFDSLSERYTDNIPTEINSTLDPVFHHAGHVSLVVDGLFTSSQYEAKSVQVLTGLSDHRAVFATIYIK